MKRELRSKLSKLQQYSIVHIIYQDHVELSRAPIRSAINSEPLCLFAIGRFVVQTETRILVWTSGLVNAQNVEESRGVAGRSMNHFCWIVKEAIVHLEELIEMKSVLEVK